jgi:hypothetical protein
MSVVESPHGFVVRWSSPRHGGLPVSHYLRHADLEARHVAHGAGAPDNRYPTYRDMLEAVGQALDEAGAQRVLIDELDDGLLLTYHCPGKDCKQRTCLTVLDPTSREELLRRAATPLPVE